MEKTTTSDVAMPSVFVQHQRMRMYYWLLLVPWRQVNLENWAPVCLNKGPVPDVGTKRHLKSIGIPFVRNFYEFVEVLGPLGDVTCFLGSLISLEREAPLDTPSMCCPGVMNTYILSGCAHLFSKRIRLVLLGICKSRLSPSCFIRCCQWVCCLHPW